MSDELNFKRNELVQFQTIFVVGNVVGLLPFIYLFPRVPIHILVPTLDLGWGIFTLLQYRAHSYGEIMAYRFMVSLFEVRSSAILVRDSWLMPELRRATFQEFISFLGVGIEAMRLVDVEVSSMLALLLVH